MRLLVFSPELLFGEAFGSLLTRRGHIIPSCSSDEAALLSQLDGEIDVLLVDLSDSDAVAALVHAKALFPEVSAIVLQQEANPTLLQQALAAGVEGVCMKSDSIEEIERVLELVSRERSSADMPPVMSAAARRYATRRAVSPSGTRLTPKERAVLTLLVRGKSTTAIAEELDVSTATVRTHLQHLFAKFGVHSRIALAAAAVRSGAANRSSADTNMLVAP